MREITLSVYQLNDYVKVLLERDPLLRQVRVKGEISNFKLHSSGHMYFSLKDDKSRVQCVFFRQNNMGLSFMPKDGMKVIALGTASVYLRDGQFQLYIDELLPDGLGELFLAYEALKKKLSEEGLFDPQYKKPLPLLPRKIAIITSNTGAAVRDIIDVIKRRNHNVDLLIIPVQVQGIEAHKQISKAIAYANTRDDIDLIITGRGGGSIEELWAFNEEDVARAIWESKHPLISAVGHETDFTIADFVADVRAATPSAAAELAVPESLGLHRENLKMKKDLASAIKNIILDKNNQIETLSNHFVFKSPTIMLNQKNQELDFSIQRFHSASQALIQKKGEGLSKSVASLQALSPLNVLSRGYSYVLDIETGQAVHRAESMKANSRIRVCFKDGDAVALVEKVKLEN
ncbi:MAG TPA: exodeoxyribonuclease VII large subunit [Bacillota bacterium]|nr:exodeoxyribonuclease VII large subunit [Bacillota bacterium]